mgnify:FL=1
MGKGEMPERVWLCTHGPSTSNSWKEISDGEVYCPKGGPYVLASLYDAACERAERFEVLVREAEDYADVVVDQYEGTRRTAFALDAKAWIRRARAALAAEKDK